MQTRSSIFDPFRIGETQQAAQEALTAAESEGEPSIMDRIGGVLKPVGQALDTLGYFSRHALREGAELVGARENTEGLSAGDVIGRRENAEDAVRDMRTTLGIEYRPDGILGGVVGLADTVAMAAVDPLTYATFGANAGATSAARQAARAAGNEAVEAVALRGGEAGVNAFLRTGTQRVGRTALTVADNTPQTLRGLLTDSATGLGRRNVDDIVERQISRINRSGRGGIGFAGHQSGIGQALAERGTAAWRGTEFAQRARPLFVPTARARDAISAGVDADDALAAGLDLPTLRTTVGNQTADTMDVALHTGGEIRRVSRDRLQRAANDPAQRQELGDLFSEIDPTDVAGTNSAITQEVNRLGQVGQANDLLQGGARLARRVDSEDAIPEGWVRFADVDEGIVAVPRVVADTLKPGLAKSSGEIMSAYDNGTAFLKQHMTLNPALNPTHVPRNMTTNILFAGMFGGVRHPMQWVRAHKARSALRGAVDAGEEINIETLVARGLDPKQAQQAVSAHSSVLSGRAGAAVDDVGDIVGDKPGAWGTRTTSRLNTWHEEVSRMAVYQSGLDRGLSEAASATLSRHAMLDYTREGLTKFEQDWMQRLVLFYKFPRRVVPQGMQYMVKYPGRAMALSNAGLGIGQGDRNEYGMPSGMFFDSPLEATTSTLLGLTGGDQGVGEGILGNANPLIQAALNVGPNARSIESIIPLIGTAFGKRDLAQEEGVIQGWLGKTGTPYPGIRVGRDTEAARGQEELEESLTRSIESGEPPRAEDILRSEAAQLDIPAALDHRQGDYIMGPRELAEALLARGMTESELGALIVRARGRTAPPTRPSGGLLG